MRIRARILLKNYELEERRKRMCYTQEDFSEIIGVNINRYQGIEQLKIKPTEEEAKNIALELDADVNILFPQGYERLVDVLKNPLEKIADYTPPLLESGEEVLFLEQSNAKMTVEKIIKDAKLSPKETIIVQDRFGLLDGELKNLEDVGRRNGVTRERIRQIEAKALDKMRCAHPELKVEKDL